jgi:Uma2 family endonuclease
MTTTKKKLLTAEDLLALHSKGIKGELIRGVFCETVSTGIEHGEIAANFAGEMRTFVKPLRLGRVFTSDSGIRLERGPDTVREPDVGFISAERLPLGTRITGYSEVVPDLVVEIASPTDSLRIMFDRAQMWLRYGVILVWVAFPETETVDVYRKDTPALTLTMEDTLDGDPVVAGFTLAVREVFE